MRVTDSPHRAGTPEHDEWVRCVFIPAVQTDRARVDARRVGAESIGGRLIHGGHEDRLMDELQRLFVDAYKVQVPPDPAPNEAAWRTITYVGFTVRQEHKFTDITAT